MRGKNAGEGKRESGDRSERKKGGQEREKDMLDQRGKRNAKKNPI